MNAGDKFLKFRWTTDAREVYRERMARRVRYPRHRLIHDRLRRAHLARETLRVNAALVRHLRGYIIRVGPTSVR